jgi:Secretion system C-terminal sorting domain
MRQYGWTLPKGWSINDGSTTTVSTGQSIYTSTTDVGLIPDPINGAGGEIDFWALPNCAPAPTADVASSHLKVLVLRGNSTYPPTVTVNGFNPVTVNCGDNSERVFTVTNVVSSCVTGYKWTIPNGWLYNGAVVTGPVNTTTGSITLTPNPNGTPGNVSVTLMINGVAVNSDTYTETVNYTVVPPVTTISGPIQFCTSGTFSVSGLPAGSGASTFTVTPISLSGSVTGSGSGNSYTINQNGASGTVSVTVSTPTPCGASIAPPVTVYVGLQAPTSIICETAGLPLNSNDVYTFVGEIYPSDPAVTYFWSVSGGTIQSGQGTSQCNVLVAPYYGPKGTYGDCRVSLSLEKTGCPEGPWLSNNYIVALSGGPTPDVRVTPNPASDHVSLSLLATTASTPATKTEVAATPTPSVSTPTATTGESEHIKLVKLYDVTGRVRKTSMYPATGIQEIFDVKDLPSGVYFIQVFTDKNAMYTQKVLVQH